MKQLYLYIDAYKDNVLYRAAQIISFANESLSI
jgi:hypothetical protein